MELGLRCLIRFSRSSSLLIHVAQNCFVHFLEARFTFFSALQLRPASNFKFKDRVSHFSADFFQCDMFDFVKIDFFLFHNISPLYFSSSLHVLYSVDTLLYIPKKRRVINWSHKQQTSSSMRSRLMLRSYCSVARSNLVSTTFLMSSKQWSMKDL